MTPTERKELEAAKDRGYVIRRDSQVELSNAFYKWCEDNERPFVAVTRRRRHAVVTLDTFLLPFELTPEAMEECQTVLLKAVVRGHWVGIGKDRVTGSRVPIEKAGEVAAELLRIADVVLDDIKVNKGGVHQNWLDKWTRRYRPEAANT